MDPALYKTVQVSRGFTYRYFSVPAKGNEKTLLFLHGFPNADTDWRHQVSFFQERGYGLIVPNLLGYGGTSKPTNPAEYRQSLMSKDLVDILDNEGVEKVVAVGHDWGAYVAARFANFQPDRTEAVGFITVGYVPPAPGKFDLERSFEATRKVFGYEVVGYWEFMSSPNGPKLALNNFEKFFNIFWPDDPKTWATDFAPLGAMQKNLEGEKVFPPPRWMSEEDKRLISEPILKNGFEAPMCYYKVHTQGHAAEDDKLLAGKSEITQPVFYLDALEDYIASEETFMAALGTSESPVQKYCKNATVKRVKVDHWVMLHIPHELNAMLLEWMEKF
ncbi:alpha/beta-hydrolase [Marasmius fiardii PR-910]|nr:alpha/beta-hydrolase [Marasmius fiardii PR-910]